MGTYDGSIVGGYQTLDRRSPYGAHDMAGNVWEWTKDWYDADYYLSAPTDNPVNEEPSTYRVRRGSAFSFEDVWLVSAARGRCLPSGQVEGEEHGCDTGVRCIRTPRASVFTQSPPPSGDSQPPVDIP